MEIIPSCRACLRPSITYIDLETTFEQSILGICLEIQPGEYTTFMDCFRICTQLKSTDCEQQMPQSICEQCGFELGIAWNFLQRAIHSDHILRQSFQNSKIEEQTNNDKAERDKEKITHISETSTDAIKEAFENDSHLENAKENAEHECNSKDTNVSNQSKKDYTIEANEEEALKLEQHFEQHSITTTTTINNRRNSLSNLINEDYYVLDVLDADIHNAEKPASRANQFVQMLNNVSCENNIENTAAVDKKIDPTSRGDCASCFQTFESEHAILRHSRPHISNGTSNIKCKICGLQITKEEMRNHLRIVHSNIVDCSQCDYKCAAYKMSDHVHRIHNEPRHFLCNICGKTFVSQSILSSHTKYHQRKVANIKSDACQICGKRFSTQHYLRLHMNVHRNERELHQCNYCDKIYISKIALENHIRLHKGETIKCDQCGKQFVRPYELNVHMRFHTRDYPFKCEVCEKKFAIKGHLRTHMWKHQGLKLQCEECGKLFTSTKALQEHSFVHSEMPFPCIYCGRGYPSKQKFKVHLKSTHLLDLTEEELLKITKSQTPKPLQRKKLTLVQADSVMKEVEVKDSEGETANEDDFLIELC
ncbi:zinc finger protein 431-like [Eurosta solidaginis]|uniref:zinc finger protein 431-like n=1 Tax=Eurosta solidaginis TaxID=178769 RepID=UPI0035306B99